MNKRTISRFAFLLAACVFFGGIGSVFAAEVKSPMDTASKQLVYSGKSRPDRNKNSQILATISGTVTAVDVEVTRPQRPDISMNTEHPEPSNVKRQKTFNDTSTRKPFAIMLTLNDGTTRTVLFGPSSDDFAIAVGDKITVSGIAARNDASLFVAFQVTNADGKTLDLRGYLKGTKPQFSTGFRGKNMSPRKNHSNQETPRNP